MDLSYGPEYDEFRGEVNAFLDAQWPLKGAEAELGLHEQAVAFRKKGIAAGYLARNIPKKYGGSEQESDALRGQVIREEFGRARAPMDAVGIGTMMLVPTLLDRGAEWQKEKWIEDTFLGNVSWCQGYSEPGSGSDLASLKTKAEIDGDDWVINGQKIWTTGALQADFMFILCRTEPEEKKHGGISYLLLDMKQPSIDIRPLRQMTGGGDFNQVFFTDARTPKDWIVGKRGEGWLVSRTTLKHERNSIGNAAQSEAVFRGLLNLAKESTIDGKPAIENPAIRQRLATLEGYVQSHKYSGYRQLTSGLRDEDAGILQFMNKLNSTNIGQEVAKIAIDLIGDGALTDPSQGQRGMYGAAQNSAGWVGQYMSSLGIAIAGGTANIQRNVIAERGLGLPRDYFADAHKR